MSATAESDQEEYCRFEEEEEEEGNRPPASWSMGKKRLTKQMSMKDTTRERAWIRRKRQVMKQRMEAEAVAGRKGGGGTSSSSSSSLLSSSSNRRRRERNRDLTDEDLDELKGFMDLGFRFTEMDGCENLRIVLPALDLLFAVKRQYSDSKLQHTPSPVSTPTTARSQRSSPSPLASPTSRSPKQSAGADSWKIVEPGDNPQHIKTKLRHWAQAVACSVRDLPNSS